MKSRRKRLFSLALLVTLVIGFAVACSQQSNNPPSAMCGYIIGDGKDGRDNRVHKIVWPNQNIDYNQDKEDVRYVPCNSRNFIINDGSIFNANGQQVGDRFTPIVAYTNSGTPIKIHASAFWTLNQDEEALNRFYELCYKYNCASDEPESGNANFSTPGWNGLLGENFGSSIDGVALASAGTIGDEIWQKHDPALYEQLAKQMSEKFAEEVRKKTGYNVDLFCGSGNSGFQDEQNHKDFNCTNVRFVIDKVDVADAGLSGQNTKATQAEQDKQLNADRLAAAKEIYGDSAAYWLGLQDTIDKCRQAQSTCVINLGGGNSPVVVPTQ